MVVKQPGGYDSCLQKSDPPSGHGSQGHTTALKGLGFKVRGLGFRVLGSGLNV